MEEIKCAVYTRKSTDEGLEKEFNTLEAQREAGGHTGRHEGARGRTEEGRGAARCISRHVSSHHRLLA